MKTKNEIWLCSFIVVGLILILANSCKKEEEDIIDVDGNVYTSVTIGTQVWMVENLKTTKYNNGDSIGTTFPAAIDLSSEDTAKYQWAYSGFESNVRRYGRLYTYWAVTDSRKICPIGWHVPSDEEWTTLLIFLGGESVAGGKLKETGTAHWTTPNTGATNESGFTALPSGFFSYTGEFWNLHFDGDWWSSTENSATTAYCLYITYYHSNVNRNYTDKRNGFSVRCLKDN
jgi:uncharacterized protein (TIGR02145 family)